jgi:hypothetical protein
MQPLGKNDLVPGVKYQIFRKGARQGLFRILEFKGIHNRLNGYRFLRDNGMEVILDPVDYNIYPLVPANGGPVPMNLEGNNYMPAARGGRRRKSRKGRKGRKGSRKNRK